MSIPEENEISKTIQYKIVDGKKVTLKRSKKGFCVEMGITIPKYFRLSFEARDFDSIIYNL